jgi:iron complex outermembrane receptor protein
MRIARSTLIGTAVAMALFGREGAVQADQATGDQSASNQPPVQEVTVTGIRYSLEQSIEQKRAATNVVDVVTAEDIGKMPDKNVADALQRVPGVTISSAGATEGGFDEADRVSIRGTNPSLTQTLINGHSVASGDWFVLDQAGTVGRSVSYTLLPAEVVGKVVVIKSSEADLVEGGVAGTVDIITRRPLDFHEQTTLQASAGAVYADLPESWDPQFSALGNWINDDKTFGVLVQIFAESRHLERQGQELLGYSQFSPTSNIVAAHPDLANVWYPDLIGSTLFQQKRERTGGMLDIQWAPNDRVDIDASGFSSKLDATNLNDNYLLWGNNFINGGTGQVPSVPTGSTLAQVCAANPGKYNGCAPGLGLRPGYVVQGNTLTSAYWVPYSKTFYGVYDQISRPDETASSNFGNLDVRLKATDQLSFLGQVGVSMGHGRTPTQDVSETLPGAGAGAAYSINGTTTAANWNLGNTVNTTPTPGGVPVPFSWIFGDQNIDVVDREVWAKIDGDFKADVGAFKDFLFGARYAKHDRNSWGVIGQGPNANGENTANYPTGYQNYPTNFGSGLGAGFPTGIWYWTPAQLAAYNLQGTNRDPVTRADWTSDYGLDEKDSAIYVQGNFGGSGWSGNIGVRAVQTKESVIQNVAAAATDPNAITTSAFGPYVQRTTDNTYTDVLPTANLKLDLTNELVARFAAGQTLARPDYSALANSISLGSPPPRDSTVPGSATGSNPNLKPIKSTNADAGLEWYYAPRALLAADAFYMDLKDYVAYGSYLQYFTQFDKQGAYQAPYQVSAPVNADGRVYGAEFQWQQPFGDYFGINTNYTYADGRQTSAVQAGTTDQLVGTSKNTFNVIGYFETPRFYARVAYTYRSAFYSGLDRSTAFSQDAVGTLAASLGYTVNNNFQITLDGLNLNNPTLKYFALNEDQPRAFYKNGAQYYLNLRFKL